MGDFNAAPPGGRWGYAEGGEDSIMEMCLIGLIWTFHP
jgi:hypothetical protein